MQVSVEKTSELSRKMTVSLPEEMVQEKMDARFKSLAREVKIDGFRPGKVPMRVVKKMYLDRVRNEVNGDLIQTTYAQALQEQKLTPAGQPFISSMNEEVAGLEYVAEFEVYPDISLDNLSILEIKKPLVTIEQADHEKMVAKLRDQQKDWKMVERVSQQGDRITLNFSGVSNGENFTDGQVEDFQLELGSNQMIPGFEDKLIGLEAGGNKTFELTFPEDYGNKKLAGSSAEFEIELQKIEEPLLPEIDEKFIKAYGITDGSLDSFNADVKSHMERELAQALKNRLKNTVMDALYEKIQIVVPTTLIDQEVQSAMKAHQANAAQQNMRLEDLDLPKDELEEKAKRRVALGLILGEIIQKNEIKVDEQKVRSTITDMAVSYEKPEDIINWYYSDEKRLNEIKHLILEEQTVEWIVNQVKVSDEKLSFSDLMEK